MTSVPTPNPAQPGTHRQEGTPVAEDRAPHTLPDTPADTVSAAVENAVDGPPQRLPRAVVDDLDTATDTPERVTDDAAREPAVSVWTTAQTAPAAQRKGRYVAEATAHPAKMLPAVAAHAIAHYTRPSDLVLDPMCGIGTTLVEAVHAGRRAVGIEYEPHWVDVARAWHQWGKPEPCYRALLAAERAAPAEVRYRPPVHRMTENLLRADGRGSLPGLRDFARRVGVPGH